VFGGAYYFFQYTNTLFALNMTSGQYGFLNGQTRVNATGNYGVKGTPTSTTVPPARWNMASFYDTDNKKFYIFGGTTGYYLYLNMENAARFSDTWSYDVNTNQWTWVHGPQLTNQPAVYGDLNSASAANVPGARNLIASYYHPETRLFYLYGGLGFTADQFGSLNDLWSYSPDSNEYTWISGTPDTNNVGSYSDLWVKKPENLPRARGGAYFWYDSEKYTFYIFGGALIYEEDGFTFVRPMSDLWTFNSAENVWMWISGPQNVLSQGSYGTKGEKQPTNYPGPMWAGSLYFDTSSKIVTIYGGGKIGDSTTNEFWTYIDEGKPIKVDTTRAITRRTTTAPPETSMEFKRKFTEPEAEKQDFTPIIIVAVVLGVVLIVVGLGIFGYVTSQNATRKKNRAIAIQQRTFASAATEFGETGYTYQNQAANSTAMRITAPTSTESTAPKGLSDLYHETNKPQAPAPVRMPPQGRHSEQVPLTTSPVDDYNGNPESPLQGPATAAVASPAVAKSPTAESATVNARPDLPDFLECPRDAFSLQQQIGSQNGSPLHVAAPNSDKLKSLGESILVKIYGESVQSLQGGFDRIFWQEVSLLWKLAEVPTVSKVRIFKVYFKIVSYCTEPAALIFQNYPGTLETVFMQKNIKFTQSVTVAFTLDLTRALEALHSRGYAHRYIKVSLLSCLTVAS
jgi:type II secretory pathway pseudopilin PulG